MKKNMRKALSWIMVLCMVLSMVPAVTIQAGAAEDSRTVNGSFVNGQWVEGGSSTVSYDVDGTEVTLSKTAQAVEGLENTYDITLSVKTSTSTSLQTASGAVVLVIDRSNSMDYCAECRGESLHTVTCKYFNLLFDVVTTSQNRMTAAKNAAYKFLESYAGTDADADRQLCIVTFDTDYRVHMDWINVAGGSGKNGYDTARSCISSITSTGGTNLEGGLYTAKNQLADVESYDAKSVILLTDGVPTYRINGGNGSDGSALNNAAAANQASAIRDAGAKLYTVCFGVANDVTYSGGPTVGNFLRGSIASSGCAYNADSSEELNAAFQGITESIQSGLSGLGLVAVDPMAANVSVIGGTGENFFLKDGAYNWRLTGATTKVEGNTTYYIYTYTYRVTIDPQFEGFEEGKYYPANKRTYLTIDGEQYEFPVPGIQATLPRRDVTVTKIWNDAQNQDGIRPAKVTVQLMEGERTIGEPVVLSKDNNWSYTWDGQVYDLIAKSEGNVRVYTVKEIDAPADYAYETSFENSHITLTNTHEVYKTAVEVTKVWNDANDQDGKRPASITVHLWADGEEIASAELTAQGGWKHVFDGLDVNRNGKAIAYTVTEDAVPGYTTTIDGYVVTNTHEVEKTSVPVTKVWDDADNQDGIRPAAITVKLLANGVDTGKTLTLTAATDWSGAFTGLDKYSKAKVIDYTLDEVAVEGYTTKVEGNTITNTHVPAVTEVSGKKTWNDEDNQDGVRPDSITVNLLRNGEVVDSKVVTADSGWAWSFTNLPKFEKGVLVKYSVTENKVEGYSASYNGYDIINTHTPEQTSVTVTKTWKDNADQDGIRPNDITVKLLADGVDTGMTLVLSDGNRWTGTFSNLDVKKAGKAIVYTIEEIAVEGYESSITGSQTEGFSVTNTHQVATVDVSGEKTWQDNDDQDGARPESITIHLTANGKTIDTKVVTAEDGWAWNFTNLPKFEKGNQIEYAVIEEAVENYSTTYNGYDITNTHTPEQTSVTVTKSWQDADDQDGIRPNVITVKLLANGQDTGRTLELSEGNKWTGSFTELDKFSNGDEIAYTVAEDAVAGYETVITGTQTEGYTITNSHNPEKVAVSGTKTWVDNNDQDGVRPASITVNLLADGEKIDSVTVTAENDWSWNFENLAKYRDQGTLVVYTVTENAVEGYTTEVNGYNITNTHAPEKTSVNVVKAWVDNDDQDGIRPADITVKLLADGEDTGKTLVLSTGNNWNGAFTDLDKYADGEEIIYTVAEDAVSGYETVITGTQTEGYTITNSHNPETVTVSGSKTWKDNDNQDGVRPESITVNLLADGEKIDTAVVTAENDWAWSFENLAKFKNQGVEIVYAIVEEAVENYSASYDGFNVTNEHTPEQTSVTVTKAWADNDDQDGIRPESIEVILLANGEETGKKLKLNAENNWTGSFTELDKYESGAEIVYTVGEKAVDGYETVITGTQTEGYVITNSHNPETVVVAGTKTWNDNNDQDGVRPESITINLMKNGAVLKTVTVTEADNWAWSFNDLPKYENKGTEIVYSITEAAAEGYTTTYDGYNVINERTPDEVSVTVTKSWVDSNDADGIRPGKVTIRLLADGKDTGKTLVLNAGNNWTGSFTGLAKNADGKQIVYTVTEDAVKGYNAVIKGDMASGFVVTNTHTYIPKTGDERSPMLWMMLMLLSGGVIVATVADQRKRYAK